MAWKIDVKMLKSIFLIASIDQVCVCGQKYPFYVEFEEI